MNHWKKSLLDRISGFAAQRVLSFSEIVSLAESVKPGVSGITVRNFVGSMEDVGALRPVRKGLWLNSRAVPAPMAAEAAQRIRAGATVSLQSVLGDAGVLNNFSSQVFCVVPVPASGPKPFLASVDAAGTRFHFKGIADSLLTGGDADDRLSSLVHYPRATAEAALVHWMYLAKSTASKMKEPDTQCDLSTIDMERLERLAVQFGVHDETINWVRRCNEREEADDQEIGWHGP